MVLVAMTYCEASKTGAIAKDDICNYDSNNDPETITKIVQSKDDIRDSFCYYTEYEDSRSFDGKVTIVEPYNGARIYPMPRYHAERAKELIEEKIEEIYKLPEIKRGSRYKEDLLQYETILRELNDALITDYSIYFKDIDKKETLNEEK